MSSLHSTIQLQGVPPLLISHWEGSLRLPSTQIDNVTISVQPSRAKAAFLTV